MQDRVIAIAEIGGDAPGDRPWPCRVDDRRGLLGIGGVDPLAAAVRGPAHQLQVGGGDAVEPGIKQASAVGAEHQVEAVARRDVAADVDLGRQRGEILRRDLRRSAGRAQRPVEPVADPAADAQRAGRHGRRLRLRECRRERLSLARLGTKSIVSTASVASIAHAGRAAVRQRRDAQRLPLHAARRHAVVRLAAARPRQRRCTAARARPRSSSPAAAKRGRANARPSAGRSRMRMPGLTAQHAPGVANRG